MPLAAVNSPRPAPPRPPTSTGGRGARQFPATLRVRGEEWLQVREAARRLTISTGRVYHLVADGRLPSITHDGLLYVQGEGVRRYAEYQRQLRHLRTTLTPL